MSSPRTDTTDTETSEKKPRSSALSPVQIAAGALAAVSSAVVMSFFGVAGTLIGAALASIISSISAALYTESLRKTNERLRQVRHLRGFTPAAPGADAAQPATSVLPAHLDPRRAPAPVRRPRWVRLTGYAVTVFVLAMGIVTGIEVIGRQPVSALVGNSTSTSAETTTLGSLTNASSSRDAPSTPGTPSPSSPAGETSGRSDAPGTGTGTPDDTTDDTTAPTTSTAPRSTAEAEPTTEAPQTSQQSPTARTTP